MMIYRAAAACALVFEMAEKCGVHLPAVPLGGNALTQLGVVFGVAFVITEGHESALRFGHSLRRGVRHVVGGCLALLRDLAGLFNPRQP